MPLTDTQWERLSDYCRQGDRETEPVFVGRGDLFQLVAGNASMCAKGKVQGRTICIAGPPGAGKTAFLSELSKRGPTGAGRGPKILCVDVDPTELHDTRQLLGCVAYALPNAWAPKTGTRVGRILKGVRNSGFSFAVLGAHLALGGSESGAEFPWRELTELLSGVRDGAVCICVDEAHRLAPTPGKQENDVLFRLHRGAAAYPDARRPPIFALLAGHSHTPDILMPSISGRYATGNLRHMQPLSEVESMEYAMRTMTYLGVRDAQREQRAAAAWVCAECAGFPHHLRNAMASIGEEMLRVNSTDLADLDGARIAAELSVRRRAYYRQRLPKDMSEALPVIVQLLNAWGNVGGVTMWQAKVDAQKVIAALDAQERTALAEAGLHTGRLLTDRMVSQGVLAMVGKEDEWACPIPSLREWVAAGHHQVDCPFPQFGPVRPAL